MKLDFTWRRELFPYTVDPCEEEDISEPGCDNCGEETELGGVRSGAFILKAGLAAILANPTTLGVWTTAKTAGNLFIIPNARGTFDGGTPVEGEGYGDQKTRVTGYDYVAVLKDPVYKTNRDFWNSIKGRKDLYFVFRTETQLHIAEATCSVAPKNPVQEDISTAVVWEVEIKWSQKALMTPLDVPTTLFDCVFVPEYYVAT
jgi:hypothetical protein